MYGNNYMNGYPYYMPNGNAMPDALTQQKMQYQNFPVPMPNSSAPMGAMAQNNELIWVLSKTEAESYPVAPNNTVVMWDKNTPTIYVKSVDFNRTPSFRTLDFTERSENADKTPSERVCKCGNNNPNKEELEALRAQITDILADISDLKERCKTLTDNTIKNPAKGE